MPRLAPQQMEVLGRRGAVRHADVALGAEGEIALEARAGVLRATAFVSVRQQHREPRGVAPFGEPRHDELIDDHLGAVCEVAVLRFPQDQRGMRGRGIAVLEPEARGFGEWAVVQLERCARARQVLDRRPAGVVVRVMQDEVALTEGAALDVLPREPDRRTLEQQRSERQRLGVGPFHSTLDDRLATALQLPLELGMDREAIGRGEQRVVHASEYVGRHRRFGLGDRGALDATLFTR